MIHHLSDTLTYSSSALASLFKNSYAVTIVVPQIDTLVMRGRTPLKKPRAPCSAYKAFAVLEKVLVSPPGCPDNTCSRVFTMSSGVVRNPELMPAQMPDAI